jgi:hypothetical protein
VENYNTGGPKTRWGKMHWMRKEKKKKIKKKKKKLKKKKKNQECVRNSCYQ